MKPTSPNNLAGLFWQLPVGILLAVITLFEGSLIWSAYCIITAWIGSAAGLAGSVSLADRMAKEYEQDGTVTLARPRLPGIRDILLFWGPSLAVVWFGQVMLDRLAEDQRPHSYDSVRILSLLESFAMYFCWIGGAFYETWRRSRHPVPSDGDGDSAGAA